MTHILRLPLLPEGLGQTNGPEPPQEVSSLLPGVDACQMVAPEDYFLLPERAVTGKTRRLVVLVPEDELDEQELSTKIWQMAAPGSLEVLFLCLAPGPEMEAYLHLRLSSLGSLTRDDRVRASFSFSSESTWLAAAAHVWRPGDLLVCYRSQLGKSQRNGRGLGARLTESLGAPLYVINSLKTGPSQRQLRLRSEWIAWSAFLFTLAAFGWVQLQLSRSFVGHALTFFLISSVLVEAWVLWEINKHTQGHFD
jgi:hypothetical protein